MTLREYSTFKEIENNEYKPQEEPLAYADDVL
jgi:hypothetical protein